MPRHASMIIGHQDSRNSSSTSALGLSCMKSGIFSPVKMLAADLVEGSELSTKRAIVAMLEYSNFVKHCQFLTRT